MRLLVIVNPASSRGDTQRVEAAIHTAFATHHLAYELMRTEHRGHAKQLVAEHGRDFDGVVAVGGDGTLHEIVQTLDVERHVLGLIPRGSGNDFAWMNGWPADVGACAARIAAGQERRIDLGLWDGGRFHTSVGVGFEARVTYESHRIKNLRGPAIYLAALARVLHDLQTYPVQIDWTAGTWSGDMLLASIGNGARVGGAFRMTPDAHNDDGMLDMCLAPKLGLLSLLRLLPRTFNGSHARSRHVRLCRGPRIRITSPAGLPVHIDGEMVGLDIKALDLQLAGRALRTF